MVANMSCSVQCDPGRSSKSCMLKRQTGPGSPQRIARLEVRKLALQGRITGDTHLVNKLKHAVDSRDYCSVLLFASAVLMPVTPAAALAPPAQAAASVHPAPAAAPASTLSPDGEPP